MPFSDPDGKREIEALIRRWVKPGDVVLDVGPGCGTYARMLKGTGVVMEGVEVFSPYIERFSLKSLYSTIHVSDIRSFQPSRAYRLVILGDVLEHLSTPDAQRVVSVLSANAPYGLISVPWSYPQGEVDGNPAERHLQDDLTPAVMRERYPGLRCEYVGKVIGIYSWQPAPETLTILIPTYARVRWLAEAVWCALHQKGDPQVVVLNDCAKQRLIFEHPRVSIINAPERFPTLGAKRNHLLELATTDWVTWLDDDDWLLPWHCTELQKAMQQHPKAKAIYPRTSWSATSGSHDGRPEWHLGGALPIVMALHRREALKRGGCGTELDCGEDQVLRGNLVNASTTEDTVPSYVYRWANGTHHTSMGPADAGVGAGKEAEIRLSRGEEPVGDVVLSPHLRFDYFRTLPSDVYARVREHWGYLPPIYTGTQTVTVGGRSYQVKIPPGYRIGP